MNPPVLELRGLSAGYADRPILHHLNLTVRTSEIVGLLGPNGAGKSTLLRCVLRACHPLQGDILLLGRPLHSLSLREQAALVAFLPQTPNLPQGMTVHDIVLAGRYPHIPPFGRPGPADLAALRRTLSLCGLQHLAHRRCETLSGGEFQRVLLAQALCQQPRLLLLDEPMNHLDLGHRVRIGRILAKTARTGHTTVLLTLHDLDLAVQLCDRIVLLGQGRILADGPPQRVLTPTLLRRTFGVTFRIRRRSPTPHPVAPD